METEAHTLNLSRAVRDLFTGVADADLARLGQSLIATGDRYGNPKWPLPSEELVSVSAHLIAANRLLAAVERFDDRDLFAPFIAMLADWRDDATWSDDLRDRFTDVIAAIETQTARPPYAGLVAEIIDD